MNRRRLLERLAEGALRNVSFDDIVNLAEGFGFRLQRVSGSYHIFVHPDLPELVNLQEVAGDAKPYQIRQFLRLVERYNLRLEDEEWPTIISTSSTAKRMTATSPTSPI